jgi:hypothetical protein
MPRRRKKYALRLRRFLNSLPSEYDSYVSVVVADSDNGEDPLGDNLIHIADCYRRIELHFDLCNAPDRRQSLHKIDERVNALITFRTALYKEANAIKKKQG